MVLSHTLTHSYRRVFHALFSRKQALMQRHSGQALEIFEPFAAYLIPRDLKAGERVFVEDLIEDFVGGEWNQGDVLRLDSCEAI